MYCDLYDFDQTIYNGESGTQFYLYCLRKYPRIIKFLPRQISAFAGYYIFHRISEEEFKEKFYIPMSLIDVNKEINLFWDKEIKRINPYFLKRDKNVPVIVCSASPVFQIKPVCDKLGVDMIVATDMDPLTRKITGKNCKGEEKVLRIKKDASEFKIRDAYTDNIKSDAPLLSLAERHRYKVKKGKLFRL